MPSSDDFGWQQPREPAENGRDSAHGEPLSTLLAIAWSFTVLVVMVLSALGAISGAWTFRLTLVLLAVFGAGFALKSVRDEHRTKAASSHRAQRSRN